MAGCITMFGGTGFIRRPILALTILGYSLFTGLTGFAQGPLQLLLFTSITRITLQGETSVGMIMVSETAPTRWRATALGGLVRGYRWATCCAL
jgi:hypothetical protein